MTPEVNLCCFYLTDNNGELFREKIQSPTTKMYQIMVKFELMGISCINPQPNGTCAVWSQWELGESNRFYSTSFVFRTNSSFSMHLRYES